MARQKKDHLIVLKLSNMAEQQEGDDEVTEEEVDQCKFCTWFKNQNLILKIKQNNHN